MSKSKKEFLGLTKTLQKISSRHQFSNVFDDFMKMSICAFSMGRMEDEYMKIAVKYNSDELPYFGQALAEMIHEYQSKMEDGGSWVDVLGNVFEETNSSFAASGAGQFFTPQSLCDMMSLITNGPEECDKDITVNDCACGSGRNLIAHSRLHPNNRFNAFYVAQDLDERCVNMCVLNFFLYGMKGIVVHMDTLSMKVYGGYRVFLADTLMGIKPLTINECYEYLAEQKEVKKEPAKIVELVPYQQNLSQATLF